MASPKIPWQSLWREIWRLIPEPVVDGRLLVALDDSINNKSGRKIFGCGFFHDHTAKLNQPSYPWSQNIVSIGVLKIIKGRWSCVPLAFRFYFMKKDIDAEKTTSQKAGRTATFQTKMAQAVEMLTAVARPFVGTSILVVADSWFGNDGLYRLEPLRIRVSSLVASARHHHALRPTPQNDYPINAALLASRVHDWEARRIGPPGCVKRHELSRFFSMASNATCSPMIKLCC